MAVSKLHLQWITVSMLSITILLSQSIYAGDAKSGAFDDDTLIGRTTLFDNGHQFGGNDLTYHLVILAVEGNTDRYNLGEGFFMGFQWYNDMYASSDSKINFQLYRFSTRTSSDQYNGYYTLANETGWIEAKPGLNVFYFNKAIPFDLHDSVSDSYYIGVMSPKSEISPVLWEPCTSSTNVVLETSVPIEPTVGQSLLFQRITSPYSCMSFSLQGIFLPTHLASSTSGSCSMYVAPFDETNYFVSQEPFPGAGLTPNSHSCNLVRAEKQNAAIEVSAKVFDFPDFDSECFGSSVQIASFSSISDNGVDIRGNFCGDKKLEEETYDDPYLQFSLSTSSFPSNIYDGYKIGVKSTEKRNVVMYVIIAVVSVIALVVIIVIIVICCVCCKKSKAKVHSNNQNQGQYPQSQTQSMYQQPKTPVQNGDQYGTKAAAAVASAPIQPNQQPNNRLPPLQPYPGQGQQVMYVNQQPNQPGGNQPIIFVGGAAIATGFPSTTVVQGPPPPAYNTVVNSKQQQPPQPQQPAIVNDPYGVPPPANYIDP